MAWREAGKPFLAALIGLAVVAGSLTLSSSLQVGGASTFNGTITYDVSTANNVGPETDYKGYNGRWTIGIDVANPPGSRDMVTTAKRGTYSFEDGATTNGSPTLTSAAQGGFTSALAGKTVTGSGIPGGTTISSCASATSCTMSANATATASGVRVTITDNSTEDVLYWKHRGALSPWMGVGCTPPTLNHRLQVCAHDAEVAMGTVGVRVGPSQTGNALTLYDSSPANKWWVDSAFYMSGAHGTGGAIAIQAEGTNQRPLVLVKNDKSAAYGFQYSGNDMRFQYFTGGLNAWEVSNTTGNFTTFASTNLGDGNTDKTQVQGHANVSGTAPALSSCGTGPSITGTDIAGYFTTGTSGTACTITFSRTYTVEPACVLRTTSSATQPTCSVSATAITCATTIASTKYHYICICPTSSCT